MSNKDFRIFLIMGAFGVGKSTISALLAKTYKNYRHVDLDEHIAKKKKMGIKEFMGKIGYEKFYEVSERYINEIVIGHKNYKKYCGQTLLIDVGSGSTFDYRAFDLTNEHYCVLLTADAEYIYETREKCKKSGMKNLHYYKYWQFGKEKEQLYANCVIKVDVAYLTPEQVAEQLNTKIKNFQDGSFYIPQNDSENEG